MRFGINEPGDPTTPSAPSPEAQPSRASAEAVRPPVPAVVPPPPPAPPIDDYRAQIPFVPGLDKRVLIKYDLQRRLRDGEVRELPDERYLTRAYLHSEPDSPSYDGHRAIVQEVLGELVNEGNVVRIGNAHHASPQVGLIRLPVDPYVPPREIEPTVVADSEQIGLTAGHIMMYAGETVQDAKANWIASVPLRRVLERPWPATVVAADLAAQVWQRVARIAPQDPEGGEAVAPGMVRWLHVFARQWEITANQDLTVAELAEITGVAPEAVAVEVARARSVSEMQSAQDVLTTVLNEVAATSSGAGTSPDAVRALAPEDFVRRSLPPDSGPHVGVHVTSDVAARRPPSGSPDLPAGSLPQTAASTAPPAALTFRFLEPPDHVTGGAKAKDVRVQVHGTAASQGDVAEALRQLPTTMLGHDARERISAAVTDGNVDAALTELGNAAAASVASTTAAVVVGSPAERANALHRLVVIVTHTPHQRVPARERALRAAEVEAWYALEARLCRELAAIVPGQDAKTAITLIRTLKTFYEGTHRRLTGYGLGVLGDGQLSNRFETLVRHTERINHGERDKSPIVLQPLLPPTFDNGYAAAARTYRDGAAASLPFTHQVLFENTVEPDVLRRRLQDLAADYVAEKRRHGYTELDVAELARILDDVDEALSEVAGGTVAVTALNMLSAPDYAQLVVREAVGDNRTPRAARTAGQLAADVYRQLAGDATDVVRFAGVLPPHELRLVVGGPADDAVSRLVATMLPALAVVAADRLGMRDDHDVNHLEDITRLHQHPDAAALALISADATAERWLAGLSSPLRESVAQVVAETWGPQAEVRRAESPYFRMLAERTDDPYFHLRQMMQSPAALAPQAAEPVELWCNRLIDVGVTPLRDRGVDIDVRIPARGATADAPHTSQELSLRLTMGGTATDTARAFAAEFERLEDAITGELERAQGRRFADPVIGGAPMLLYPDGSVMGEDPQLVRQLEELVTNASVCRRQLGGAESWSRLRIALEDATRLLMSIRGLDTGSPAVPDLGQWLDVHLEHSIDGSQPVSFDTAVPARGDAPGRTVAMLVPLSLVFGESAEQTGVNFTRGLADLESALQRELALAQGWDPAGGATQARFPNGTLMAEDSELADVTAAELADLMELRERFRGCETWESLRQPMADLTAFLNTVRNTALQHASDAPPIPSFAHLMEAHLEGGSLSSRAALEYRRAVSGNDPSAQAFASSVDVSDDIIQYTMNRYLHLPEDADAVDTALAIAALLADDPAIEAANPERGYHLTRVARAIRGAALALFADGLLDHTANDTVRDPAMRVCDDELAARVGDMFFAGQESTPEHQQLRDWTIATLTGRPTRLPAAPTLAGRGRTRFGSQLGGWA